MKALHVRKLMVEKQQCCLLASIWQLLELEESKGHCHHMVVSNLMKAPQLGESKDQPSSTTLSSVYHLVPSLQLLLLCGLRTTKAGNGVLQYPLLQYLCPSQCSWQDLLLTGIRSLQEAPSQPFQR